MIDSILVEDSLDKKDVSKAWSFNVLLSYYYFEKEENSVLLILWSINCISVEFKFFCELPTVGC